MKNWSLHENFIGIVCKWRVRIVNLYQLSMVISKRINQERYVIIYNFVDLRVEKAHHKTIDGD